MEAAPDDNTAVQHLLDVLTSLAILSAITLYHQRPAGTAHITVRKLAHQSGPRPQHHYWWEARAGTGEQVWEGTGEQAYLTAEAAYQAAVQAVSSHLAGEETAGEA